MGVFDSIKKIVSGDIAHDAADSGNPVKVGGKASSSLPAAVASGDRTNMTTDLYGRQIVLPHAAKYDADGLDAVSDGDIGHLRMTQYRDLIVAPNHLRAMYFSSNVIALPNDIGVGVSNWYTIDGGPTTAFFDGSDGGFGGNARYIHIPMYRFSRGATIGLFNNLGVSLTVKLRGRITSYNTSNQANGWRIWSGSLSALAYTYFSPLPLADTAEAEWNYVPQLAAPFDSIVIELTPASDPSTGYFIFTVAR